MELSLDSGSHENLEHQNSVKKLIKYIFEHSIFCCCFDENNYQICCFPLLSVVKIYSAVSQTLNQNLVML